MIEEIGPDLKYDFMGQPLSVGSKVMLPPLMPCGECYYCVHYPVRANKCLNPTYYGRYIPYSKPPHLWGGWAEMVYVDLDMLPGTKVYRLPDDMSLKLASLAEPLTSCVRGLNRAIRNPGGGGRVSSRRYGGRSRLRPDRTAGACRGSGDGRRPGGRRRRAGEAPTRDLQIVRRSRDDFQSRSTGRPRSGSGRCAR